MQAPENTPVWKSLALTFAKALAEALSKACTSSWKAVLADEPFSARPNGTEAACFRFNFAGSLEGEALLVIKQTEVLTLGLRGLTAGQESDAHLSGLLTALETCTPGLSELLLDHGSVTVKVERVEKPELAEEAAFELWISADQPAVRVSLHLLLDGAMVASLRSSAAKAFTYPTAAESPANLDLVMDVELNVTLRFGQRQLSLREVLDLTSGSVVELDRQVDEPVELVLDGRVVARGEAVIIDGNYGMRITQVLQPLVA